MSAKITDFSQIPYKGGNIAPQPQRADASKFDAVEPAPAKAFKSPFIARTANEWIQDTLSKPVPKKLFGELIIEDEITVLFAKTNVGKTLLAVQIGQAIASGKSSEPFPVPVYGRKVLYIDYELSARQFTKRYSQNDGHVFSNPFRFSDNFIRLESGYADVPDGMSMAEYYLQSIAHEVDAHGAQVVVIDNITWLNSKLEKSQDAAPFMMGLTKMKREKKLTILILAHTPKLRNSDPITIYDLQGSAMISNFVDAAFSIGYSSQDPGMRYIKQVKCRDGEILFSSENVATCALEMNENFLGFTFRHYEEERNHLRQRTEAETAEKEEKVLSLHKAGKSLRDIERETGVTKSSVQRIVKKGKSAYLVDNEQLTENDDEIPW